MLAQAVVLEHGEHDFTWCGNHSFVNRELSIITRVRQGPPEIHMGLGGLTEQRKSTYRSYCSPFSLSSNLIATAG